MPIRRRSGPRLASLRWRLGPSAGFSAIVSPSTSIEPRSGCSSPQTSLHSTVLPAAAGPISPIRAPRATSSEAAASTRRRPKLLWTSATRIASGGRSASAALAAPSLTLPGPPSPGRASRLDRLAKRSAVRRYSLRSWAQLLAARDVLRVGRLAGQPRERLARARGHATADLRHRQLVERVVLEDRRRI